ncbi:MAG: flagellar basal body-associated FliL family protein [Thermacetogeniaceae bacterium]
MAIDEEETVAVSKSAGSKIDGKAIFIAVGLVAVLFVVIMGFILVKKTSGAAKPVPEKAILHDMGEFTTNLSDISQLKYIKVKVVLRLDNNKLENEIKDQEPILQDNLISLLNSKTSTDIMGERSKLKSEAITALNSHLTTGKVIDVYFSDLVMQ